jgi:hypothetical protein
VVIVFKDSEEIIIIWFVRKDIEVVIMRASTSTCNINVGSSGVACNINVGSSGVACNINVGSSGVICERV